MSALLDIGKQCSTCDTIDFLPISCRYCAKPFCSSHIQSHICPEAPSSSVYISGESVKRAQCQVDICREPTLESAGDVGGSESAVGLRCQGCGGAFCISHRMQDSHNCTAPRDRDKYHTALAERKAYAKDALSKAFPDLAGRVIPKPPPGRDVVRESPATPAERPQVVEPVAVAVTPKPQQTKAEKLRSLSLRKLKSLARSLDPKAPVGDEVYFSWEVDENGESVRRWMARPVAEREEAMGKRISGMEKARINWVPKNMSAGRVLDLVAKESKISNDYSPSDASKNLGLIALSNPPLTPAPRSARPLDLSKSIGEQIDDCSRIVVMRGPL